MKLILFDFDGVIVDSFTISYQSYSEAFRNPADRESYRSFFEGNIYDHEAVKSQIKSVSSEEDTHFQKYVPRLMDTDPIPEMLPVLEAVSHTAKLVIVSSSVTAPIERYLKKHALLKFFARVYGADVHQSKFEKIKMALKEFKASPDQSIFITDTLGDMREATRADIRSIGVEWGFHDRETLAKGSPLLIVKNAKELKKAISDWMQ